MGYNTYDNLIGPQGMTGSTGFNVEDWITLFEEEKRKKLLKDRELKIFKLRSKWEQ